MRPIVSKSRNTYVLDPSQAVVKINASSVVMLLLKFWAVIPLASRRSALERVYSLYGVYVLLGGGGWVLPSPMYFII